MHALILTDGKPGHENQSRALADGLGLTYDLLPCTYPTRWRKTLSLLLDRLHLSVDLTRLLPRLPSTTPPTLLIGAGSNTFYPLKVLAKHLQIPSIALLTPKGYRLDDFDIILSPAFDNPPPRDNILTLPTNLTPARPHYYQSQTEAFLQRYTPQKSRAVGVIIGGKNPIADVTPEWLEPQLQRLFAATPECEHWVTTSRRTSPEVDALLDRFPFEYKLIFSREQFNPIPAFVTQCERLFVTAESTGMLSEAVAIGHSAVEILDNLISRKNKFARFVDHLCTENYAHLFDGTLGNATRKVDLTPLFHAIRQKIKF